MEITPLLLFEIAVLVIGFGAICAFCLLYFRLLRGYLKLQNEYGVLKEKTTKESQEILVHSNQQALEMLSQSKILTAEMKNKLSQILEETTKRESASYKGIIETVGKELKQESLAKVGQMSAELEKNRREVEGSLQQKVDALYVQAEKDVAELTKQKIEKLNNTLYAVVEDVLEKAGLLLTHEDHEQLVLKALEEAKKNHGL